MFAAWSVRNVRSKTTQLIRSERRENETRPRRLKIEKGVELEQEKKKSAERERPDPFGRDRENIEKGGGTLHTGRRGSIKRRQNVRSK